MANNWVKLDVFNGDQFIGSFYADAWNKKDCIDAINKEYGVGKWTRYYAN